MKIISQAELAIKTGKSKQYIHSVVNRINCPIDIKMISGVPYIVLTEKTNNWIKEKQSV